MDQLLFLDECGFTQKTADRCDGRSLQGDRCIAAAHGVREFKYTGCLCVGLQGVVSFNLIQGK